MQKKRQASMNYAKSEEKIHVVYSLGPLEHVWTIFFSI